MNKIYGIPILMLITTIAITSMRRVEVYDRHAVDCMNKYISNDTIRTGGCPISTIDASYMIYRNDDAHASEPADVVVMASMKIHSKICTEQRDSTMKIDSTVRVYDKASHSLLHTYRNHEDTSYPFHIQPNNVSTETEVYRVKYNSSVYYRVDINRVVITRGTIEAMYPTDHYHTGGFLLNMYIHTTVYDAYYMRRTCMSICLCIVVILSIYYAYSIIRYTHLYAFTAFFVVILHLVSILYCETYTDLSLTYHSKHLSMYVGIDMILSYYSAKMVGNRLVSNISMIVLLIFDVVIYGLRNHSIHDMMHSVDVYFAADYFSESPLTLSGTSIIIRWCKLFIICICYMYMLISKKLALHYYHIYIPMIQLFLIYFYTPMFPFRPEEKNIHKIVLEYAYIPIILLSLQSVSISSISHHSVLSSMPSLPKSRIWQKCMRTIAS
jgi:hypothetical protein